LRLGNQKQFCRARLAFRARLGLIIEVDLTDEEIAVMLAAAANPNDLDDVEILALAVAYKWG
jgi:hypothetical protein